MRNLVGAVVAQNVLEFACAFSSNAVIEVLRK